MSACSRLLLRVCLSRTRWFLPGQKACERRSPVPLHGPRGVRFDVTVGDHEVYDLAEKIERVSPGHAGRSPSRRPGLDIHIVMDNYATHKTAPVKPPAPFDACDRRQPSGSSCLVRRAASRNRTNPPLRPGGAMTFFNMTITCPKRNAR